MSRMPSEQFNNMVQMFKTQRAAAAGEPNILELRQGFEMLAQLMPKAEADVAAVDANGVPSERISTDGADDARCILYLHGGGFCIGSLNTHRHVAAHLSRAAGTPVLLIDYRLAPENPYPAAVDDAKAAYRWLLDGGVEPRKLAIAGESAGGGLTVTLQIAARDEGLPLPAASAPHSPYADLADLGEVTEEALDIDFLRPEALDIFCSSYVGAADKTDPLLSPVNADLSGLPPMLIQAGGAEILCDTARRLAARAKDCGVDVTLEIEPGLFHAWQLFAGALPEAAESIARTGAFFKEHWA